MFYVQEGYITQDDFIQRVENEDGLDELVTDIRRTAMVEKSLDVARRYAQAAADTLSYTPGGKFADHLSNIAEYALARAY
jgi:geranylgeranyl pyrophosphate synthase